MNNKIEQFGRRVANTGWRAAASVVLVGSSIGLTACEPQNSPVAPPAVVRPLDVTPPRVVLGPVAPTTTEVAKPNAEKEYVISAIHELPSSAIKDLLVSRIEPLLKTPTPKSIDIAGITIPVHGFTVSMNTISGTKTLGQVSLRSNLLKNPSTVVADTKVYIPYVDLSKPEDMDKLSGVSNGTPFIISEIKNGTKLFEGIWPDIQIDTPDYTVYTNPTDRASIERIKNK